MIVQRTGLPKAIMAGDIRPAQAREENHGRMVVSTTITGGGAEKGRGNNLKKCSLAGRRVADSLHPGGWTASCYTAHWPAFPAPLVCNQGHR